MIRRKGEVASANLPKKSGTRSLAEGGGGGGMPSHRSPQVAE
jgi:hypothetical protein